VGVKKNGTVIPAETIGGLLNRKVWESREKQKYLGVQLKPFPFSVVRHRGKNYEEAPFSQKQEILEKVRVAIPLLAPPTMVVTAEEKINLLNAIKAKKHPLTEEGVVLVDKDHAGAPIKAKTKKDFDVFVRSVHPAVSGKTGEPHERAGSISYSWTPNGPVIGQVGGFKHQEARDMLGNPDRYIGRVAKVRATKVFRDGEELGALFQPRFAGWHLDKGDIEKSAMWLAFASEIGRIHAL